MKSIFHTTVFILVALVSCDITSKGTYYEKRRVYNPDSTKYIVTCGYDQGAWDGGRSSLITIIRSTDSLTRPSRYLFSSYDIDDIYWQGNDTVIVVEKFTEFMSHGKSNLSDTILNDVFIKITQLDPINTSFQRKIFYRDTSPNDRYDLIVYKYVKPENGYYFLNVSIIEKGDSIPKFGNFYISRYDYDCFTDIRWNGTSTLDIKVHEGCYHAFKDYLVKNGPDIPYQVQIDETINGNTQSPIQ